MVRTGPFPIRYSPFATSLFLLREIASIRRLLALARGHQEAVGAQEIVLLADRHVAIALRADELGPIGPRIGIADVAAGYGPGARQRMVVDGDLVVHETLVG